MRTKTRRIAAASRRRVEDVIEVGR